MRCKSCDYLLWNLKARQCPECGAAFRPSEYEFTANSVRFCCPHCDQSYFGTDDHGHLVPREFECVSCRQRVRLDDTVLRPAEGVEEAQTKPDRMPWLERERRGVLRAWFATIGAAMTRPQSLMRAIPDSTSTGRETAIGSCPKRGRCIHPRHQLPGVDRREAALPLRRSRGASHRR